MRLLSHFFPLSFRAPRCVLAPHSRGASQQHENTTLSKDACHATKQRTKNDEDEEKLEYLDKAGNQNSDKMSASRDPPPSAESKAMFACDDLRREIVDRWRTSAYRDLSFARLRSLEERGAIERKVKAILAEVKGGLSARPWHGTLKLICFDLNPQSATEVVSLIERFASGKENVVVTRTKDPKTGAEATVEGSVGDVIVEAVPGMKDHADTAMYMRDVILPFRSFVVAQVVSSLMDPHGDPSEGSEDSTSEVVAAATPEGRRVSRHASSPNEQQEQQQRVRGSTNAKASGLTAPRAPPPTKHLRASHAHAAHHAKDIDDVLDIDAMAATHDRAGLQRHIDAYRRQGVCTRYAEFRLVQTDAAQRTGGDAGAKAKEWIKALTPLAEAGLAHAQFELGALLVQAKSPADAVVWFERAAGHGHSKALLALGRHHMTRLAALRRAGRTEAAAGSNDKARVIARASAAASASGVRGSEDDELSATKAALRAFDNLGESNWDEATPDDLSQAAVLLRELRRANVEAEGARVAARGRGRWWRSWGVAGMALLALLLAWGWGAAFGRNGGKGLRESDAYGDESATAATDEPTHVSEFRHVAAGGGRG